MTKMLIGSAKLFRAVQAAQSTEATRYYLCGVFISPCEMGGAYLIATDGHAMLIGHDPDAKDVPEAGVIVSMKMPAGAHGQVEFDLETKTATTIKGRVAFEVVDGYFPDWRRVLPKQARAVVDGKVTCVPTFGTALSEVFVKAAKVFSGGCTRTIPGETEGDPAWVEFYRVDDARILGVAMPSRRSVLEPSWYGWTKPVKLQTETEAAAA